MAKATKPTTPMGKAQALRDQVLETFGVLQIPMRDEQLDAAVARAEKEGLSCLQFLQIVIGEQADRRRERRVERRIRDASLHASPTLEAFDWKFNARTIDRVQIQTLAEGEFISRHENLVMVGQSGLGKSHLIQGIGRQACVLDYRVRYTTSAALLSDLTACLADKTLPSRLRYYSRFDLLIIDEFGLDRNESPQAVSLLYKVIDARTQQRSTAVVTNIDFEAWGEYLGDAPLAMALLDRLVDGAIILKLKGKSFRAARAQHGRSKATDDQKARDDGKEH